jgi:hypothetical protein
MRERDAIYGLRHCTKLQLYSLLDATTGCARIRDIFVGVGVLAKARPIRPVAGMSSGLRVAAQSAVRPWAFFRARCSTTGSTGFPTKAIGS